MLQHQQELSHLGNRNPNPTTPYHPGPRSPEDHMMLEDNVGLYHHVNALAAHSIKFGGTYESRNAEINRGLNGLSEDPYCEMREVNGGVNFQPCAGVGVGVGTDASRLSRGLGQCADHYSHYEGRQPGGGQPQLQPGQLGYQQQQQQGSQPQGSQQQQQPQPQQPQDLCAQFPQVVGVGQTKFSNRLRDDFFSKQMVGSLVEGERRGEGLPPSDRTGSGSGSGSPSSVPTLQHGHGQGPTALGALLSSAPVYQNKRFMNGTPNDSKDEKDGNAKRRKKTNTDTATTSREDRKERGSISGHTDSESTSLSDTEASEQSTGFPPTSSKPRSLKDRISHGESQARNFYYPAMNQIVDDLPSFGPRSPVAPPLKPTSLGVRGHSLDFPIEQHPRVGGGGNTNTNMHVNHSNPHYNPQYPYPPPPPQQQHHHPHPHHQTIESTNPHLTTQDAVESLKHEDLDGFDFEAIVNINDRGDLIELDGLGVW